MKKSAFAALLAVAMSPVALNAATLPIDYQTSSSPFGVGDLSSPVHIESWGYDGYANAGRFELTSSSLGDFFAFCIDLAQGLYDGHLYEDTPDLFDPTVIENIDRLFTSSYDLIVDDTSAAGFQVALWEVISDTPTGFDLDGGTFYTVQNASGVEHNPAVESIAEGFLSGLPTAETGGFELSFLFSETSQDVITAQRIDRSPSSVPLPATGLLLIFALVGIGLNTKREKAKPIN